MNRALIDDRLLLLLDLLGISLDAIRLLNDDLLGFVQRLGKRHFHSYFSSDDFFGSSIHQDVKIVGISHGIFPLLFAVFEHSDFYIEWIR